MKKLYLLVFAFTLVSGQSFAQVIQNNLPQVFTPNAFEIGKYGRTPVNYFNGLPNITVPLTEVHAKGYDLPVYLTYHASGNKPDQHPGWVGQGWALHAGGGISRVINGQRDELSATEYGFLTSITPSYNPGYFYHMDETQIESNWEDTSTLVAVAGTFNFKDHEPDEFILDLEGIHASFFFVGQNDIRIVSKSDASFDVQYELATEASGPGLVVFPHPTNDNGSLKAYRFTYIKSFTICDREGNKYYFGGDDSAIEYSITPRPTIQNNNGTPQNVGTWKATATSNTWLLSRIERADGETILFTYEKDGTPIVKYDHHQGEAYTITQGHPGEGASFDTRDYPSFKNNISFYFLQPSYLKKIQCHISGDYLDFSRTQSTELKYNITAEEFNLRVGDYNGYNGGPYSFSNWMSRSYYEQLTAIDGSGRHVAFSYSSDTTKRLTLQEVQFKTSATGAVDNKYTFSYNSTALPGYNAKQTDIWGYYNGIYYGNNYGTYGSGLESVRVPDATKMQAEILTEMTYPTGGKTVFEYEPHTYSKTATVYPISLNQETIDKMAGGLRVKSITDYPGGGKQEKRTFSYNNPSTARSSGILSGSPRCRTSGHVVFHDNMFNYEIDYVIYSESPIFPLSETDGNHVTYSEVKETYPDGGYTIYSYSNYDTNDCLDEEPAKTLGYSQGSTPYSRIQSRSLKRGLLLKRTDYKSGGDVVRNETNTYLFSPQEFFKSVAEEIYCQNAFTVLSYVKKYCYYPSLSQKVVTTYLDEGSYTETYNYQYNDDRRKTTETHTVKGISDGTVTFYPADRTGPFYTEMQQSGMSGIPVGQVKTQNGQVVSGQELVFKPISVTTESGTKKTYLPDKLFTTELSAPVALATYSANPAAYLTPTPDIEFRTYDSNGNLTGSGTPDGILTTYRWSADALHPTLVAKGVNPGRITYRDTYRQVSFPIYYTQGNTYSRNFATLEPTTVTITLNAAFGFDWLGYVSVDNQRATLVSIAIAETPPQEWMNYASTYPSSVSFSIPAGTHTLRMESGAFRISPSATSNPSGSFYCIFEEAAESTTPGETLALYDFEDGTGNVAGFRGGSAHSCPYTVDHTIPSDRNYVIDYMLYTNGSWQYNRETYAGGNKTIGSSGKRVDNIRIFPEDCDIITASYDDAGLMTTRTDARGVTESYEYDALQRLVRVRDNTGNNGNITEEYTYTYANGTGNSIHNSIASATYTKADNTTHRTAVSYLDSLGRPTQNVLVNGAASGWDLVTLQDYDACGREFRKWLPAPVQAASGRTAGDWSTLAQIQTGGNQVYPSGDAYRYGQPIYEASPRDRVKEYYGPGAAWRSTPKHRIRTTLLSNTTASASSVTYYRGFTLSWSGNTFLTLSRATVPSATSIRIVRTDDEDEQATLEFTNSFGQTVLVRQVYGTSTFYDTHYIYDNLGRLTAVLPPELTATLEAGGASSWNYADISGMAYLYCYDSRGNCIARSLPGAGWTYTVYDMGNRPVLAQDAAQRAQSANAWTFALPDRLGRPALRGTTTMTVNAFADPYKNTVVQASLPKTPTYSGTYRGYVLSGITLSSPVLLEVDYYDAYGFAGTSPFPAANNADFAYDSSIGTSFSAYYAPSAQGMQTGSLLKVLDNSTGNQYLWFVSYYDDRSRVVQNRMSTHLGGVEKDWFLYDFIGNVTKRKTEHKPSSGTSLVETTTQTYDTWDRPLVSTHQIGSGTAVTVSNRAYDKAGRLITESRNGASALATTYSYNIRSWVTGISGSLFSETLNYQDAPPVRWGGDVSKVSWTDGQSSNLKSYSLAYDTVGRLKTASFSDAGNASANFTEKVTQYDGNGNIQKLQRYGRTGASTYGKIDDLVYTYSGNKATSIKDTGAAAYSSDFRFSNGTNNTYSYSYDAAGRMTADGSKGISSITWNVLGLPQTVTFTDGATVSYSYAADGTKLREARTASSTTSTTDYTGDLVLENGTRSRLLFDGGYVSVSNSGYHFFITDHLGSVRVVANTSGTAEEYNHYYPLGGPIAQYSSSTSLQPIKFQGKEWGAGKGLDLYDFGARRYDPASGRWLSQDPLAEKYYAQSPYLFCSANPLLFVDSNGASTQVYQIGQGRYVVTDQGDPYDGDNNIYVGYFQDGVWQSSNYSIGRSLSALSFYDSGDTGNGWSVGSIIDLNDNSGKSFLKKMFSSNIRLGIYMENAQNFHEYDFKSTNGTTDVLYKNSIDYYRGMPFLWPDEDGLPTIVSARDVGNIVAGYYAGINGFSWNRTRKAMNKYDASEIEAMSSQAAQYYGWDYGHGFPLLTKSVNFLISLPTTIHAYYTILKNKK